MSIGLAWEERQHTLSPGSQLADCGFAAGEYKFEEGRIQSSTEGNRFTEIGREASLRVLENTLGFSPDTEKRRVLAFCDTAEHTRVRVRLWPSASVHSQCCDETPGKITFRRKGG